MDGSLEVSQASADSCPICPSRFSLVNGKYSCEICHKVYCGECSLHQVTRLGHESDPPQQVCDGCVFKVAQPGINENITDQDIEKATVGFTEAEKREFLQKLATLNLILEQEQRDIKAQWDRLHGYPSSSVFYVEPSPPSEPRAGRRRRPKNDKVFTNSDFMLSSQQKKQGNFKDKVESDKDESQTQIRNFATDRFVDGKSSYIAVMGENYDEFLNQPYSEATTEITLQNVKQFAGYCELNPEEEKNWQTLLKELQGPFDWKFAARMYTADTFFYRRLNGILRSDSKEAIHLLAPYIQFLLEASEHLPFQGMVYRKFSMTEELQKQYQVGQTFYWPAFTSTSLDKEVTQRFSEINMLFEITIPEEMSYCAAAIAALSKFSEREVLLSPYTFFRVTNVTHEAGMTHCHLRVEGTADNLTGIWASKEDGSTYFFHQNGNQVFLFAESLDRFSWVRAAHGVIKDDNLKMNYGDLPLGKSNQSGVLQFKLDWDFRIINLSYHASKNSVPIKQTLVRKSFISKESFDFSSRKYFLEEHPLTGLTGKWFARKEGKETSREYWMRQYGSSVFWLAHHGTNSSPVGIGKYDEASQKIKAVWSDVPLKNGRSHGIMEIEILEEQKEGKLKGKEKMPDSKERRVEKMQVVLITNDGTPGSRRPGGRILTRQ